MKKKSIIILTISGVIILILGIILLTTNKIISNKKNKLQIIDATYTCANTPEKFYEDTKYIYSFPCIKSSSVYVKFENGNKMLVIDALETNKVTIEELLDAGLEVEKEKKWWRIYMNKKLVLELPNHNVYYIKTDTINYYITIPKIIESTNISIELKNKMGNYDIEKNDELWVMENIKNTFSYIDNYNITLVLPILKEEEISILEKIDNIKYEEIDKLISYTINSAYITLKEHNKKVDNQIILLNNDRYKTFIIWFTTKYKNRVISKNLLELVQYYNANATSYKKLETPVMSFVIGSYNTEINAPKIEQPKEQKNPKVTKTPELSYGYATYWILAIVTITVSTIVAIIAFSVK